MMRAVVVVGTLLLVAAMSFVQTSFAQSSRDSQQRLERIRGELKNITAEQRRLEGQRSDVSRELRQLDERVSESSRALRATEAALKRERKALSELQTSRDHLQTRLGTQREELNQLLRAAYTAGDEPALKLLLAQDQVADADRLLIYQRYLQQARAQRITALTTQLQELVTVEQQIIQKQARLEQTRRVQRSQLAKLEQDRRARAGAVTKLDQRYRDRRARAQALGRDAKSLEKLLARLRAAAAKAAATRVKPATRTPGKQARVATTPIRVGGLSWPVAGTLLAGYGSSLPDGRNSEGVLIAAAAGSSVRAVADGRVVFADWMNGYGLILIIDHGGGTMSLYAHNDALLRDAGDSVKRGDAVTSVGNSGGQDRTALYFELRRNGQPVNPNAWLQKR